jgi:hypothetical protein
MIMQLGVIAEDQSDVDVLQLVVQKLTKKTFTIQKFVGHGSGKILGKCRAWADNLHQRGCDRLVLIHDLDNKNRDALRNTLNVALTPCPVAQHVIVIAIQEIEAWLLADHVAVTQALSLKRPVGKIANPETIIRPKEYLRDLVYQRSGKSMRYINTVHNKLIAAKVSVKNLRRCTSFVPLEEFAKRYM